MARGALFVLRNGKKGRGRRKSAARVRAGRRSARGRARNRLGQFVRANRKHHRKHSRRRHSRKNGIGFRSNGIMVLRNGRKGRKHHRKHRGHGRRRSRKNGIGMRSNGIMVLRNGIGLRSNGISLRSNGVMPSLIGLAIPMIAGAGALAVVHLGLEYGLSALPIPDDVMAYIEPVGYTAGGLAAAMSAGLLAKLRVIPPAWAAAFGGAALVGGAAVDAFRYLTSEDSPFGDGGMWSLGDAQSGASLFDAYQAAAPMDATTAPADLDPEEGQAAIAGPRAWLARFPFTLRPEHIMDGRSRFALARGHRWGWAVRLVGGWDNFRKIVMMPPAKRQAYIANLKMKAIELLQQAQAAQPLQIADQSASPAFASPTTTGMSSSTSAPLGAWVTAQR